VCYRSKCGSLKGVGVVVAEQVADLGGSERSSTEAVASEPLTALGKDGLAGGPFLL
jgi:hypothetical protein